MHWLAPWTARRWQRAVLLAVLTVAMAGGFYVSAAHFPHGYDWQRTVISELTSPHYNPGWHWASVMGLATSATCMLALLAWIERELRAAGGGTLYGMRWQALLWGVLLGVAGQSTPYDITSLPGLIHVIFCNASFYVAEIGYALCLLACVRARLVALGYAWAVVVCLPFLAGLGCRIVSLVAWPEAWNLGFWEWVIYANMVIFLGCAVVLIPSRPADHDRLAPKCPVRPLANSRNCAV